MKTAIALLLTLFLVTILFTGCGEETATTATTTNTDVTTTVAADVDTTVSNDATTTTLRTTDHANGTGGTTATSTTTTKPTAATVDPKNYKDNYYYVGALQPSGTGLVRPRILFEGEYAVVMHYMYSTTKEDPDQQPFEHQGKTYYGQGEGMSPYTFELTATEIVIKDANNGNAIVMTLALKNDSNMQVITTTDTYFPVGLILEPTAQ